MRPRYPSRETGEEDKLEKSVLGGSELTKLASSDLEHKELKVIGFYLTVGAKEKRDTGAALELNTWLDGSIRKADFIKRG